MENGNSGLCWGYIRDNGKEHFKKTTIGYICVLLGIMEQEMETMGYIGVTL